MLASTAASMRRPHNLRPLDPTRDLDQIADLIEESFAGEIGRAGIAAVRELRAMSALGSLVWLLDRISGEFRDSFTGFVWEQGGQVIGNVTLSRPRPDSQRWHISNVAVAEPYRGQGIGRELMIAALNYLRRRDGEWAILQVRHNNAPALHLYESLGFVPLCITSELYRVGQAAAPRPAELPNGFALRSYAPADWRPACDLILAATTTAERWLHGMEDFPLPRSAGALAIERIGDFLARRRTWRLSLERDGQLVGFVLVRGGRADEDNRITLHVHPRWRGLAEPALVSQSLLLLGKRLRQDTQVEHSAGHETAIAAFWRQGFIERRRLMAMRLALQSEPAHTPARPVDTFPSENDLII